MINSHYVPQFILRNFYVDDKITYCDLENKTIQLICNDLLSRENLQGVTTNLFNCY